MRFKIFIKRVLSKSVRELIYFFTEIKKNQILLIQESYAGSNTFALYNFSNQFNINNVEIILFKDSKKYSGFKNYINKHRLIGSSKIIITTHASYRASRKQILFQLWHGGFIKKNGIFLSGDKNGRVLSPWSDVDYVLSYSETYTTLMNACMALNPQQYIVTGAPRNDFIYLSDGNLNLTKIFGSKVRDSKIIFYLPTYKEYNSSKDKDNFKYNPFGYEEFNPEDFDNFLSKNNIKIIFKPHPNEQEIALNFLNKNKSINILILRDIDLQEKNLDLYEIINAAHVLITDYSSIFYDYLLLERPILFSIPDIKKYIASRGFLVESYEDFVPGPKVFSQIDLQREIEISLKNTKYYSEKRMISMRLQHRYFDAKSSQRVWNFVLSLLK